MELWIRSQDKNELIPIKEKLKVYEGDLIQTSITSYQTERHYNIIHNTDFLGEYKSKDRALEVLDEIQKLVSQEEYLHIRKSSLNNLDDIAEPKYILQSCGLPKVYEMPKE